MKFEAFLDQAVETLAHMTGSDLDELGDAIAAERLARGRLTDPCQRPPDGNAFGQGYCVEHRSRWRTTEPVCARSSS